ncbi:hypothetical protein BCM0079_3529 [Bacillus cereus]|nr:hypothetical protein BCM0079_3529 [Bacillus cereus]
MGFKEDTFTTKKLQQKITGIIALCDSENIKYKYYEKGFNKGYKNLFICKQSTIIALFRNAYKQ